MKQIIMRQYKDIVSEAAKRVAGLAVPPEGWIRTLRKALGINGAQLGRLSDSSRAQVANAERNELAGVVTLKTLNKMASAMGCRVVYAIVPETSVDELINKRANERALELIGKADTHMALESQIISKEQRQFELQRLQQELIKEMPSDLWNDN